MPSGSFDYEIEGLGFVTVEWEGTRGTPPRFYGPDGGDPGDPDEIDSITVWFDTLNIDLDGLYIKLPMNLGYKNLGDIIHERALEELADWEPDSEPYND